MIPHLEKLSTGGEDALLLSSNLLAVADGVGGWTSYGVNAGVYSRRLCELIDNKMKSSFDKYIDDPKRLLWESVK
jgi:serine/threonine protein phosphatase PrpC